MKEYNFRFVQNYNISVISILIILFVLTLYFKSGYLSTGKLIFLSSSIYYLIHTIQIYKRAKKEIKQVVFLNNDECQITYFSNMVSFQKIEYKNLSYYVNNNDVMLLKKGTDKTIGKINNKGFVLPDKLDDFILLLELKNATKLF